MTSSAQNSKQVLAQKGSAATPSYTFLGNNNTGWYLSATNEISASTNGTAALTINASQNVGIGTASPTTILEVYSATSAQPFVRGDSSVNFLLQRSSTDAVAPFFTFRKSRGTTASPAAVSSGDNMGQLLFSAYGGTNWRSISSVRSYVDTYTSDTDISSYLTFYTSPTGGVAQSERMRITAAGNVGIGTSSPAAQFVVSNAGAQGVEITGSNGSIQVYNRSTSAYGTMNLYGNTLYFRTGTSPAINMTLDASGNVGIGTSSPGSTLDVNGTVVARCPAGGTGLLMRGRSSDNLSQILGYDNGVTTLYGQLQFASTGGGVTTLISNGATGYTNFFTNGSERMRIDSSGNLLVGKTSSSGNKIEVPGAGLAGQGSTNVSTSATTIFTISQNSTGAFVVIYGDDGSNGFMDCLFFLAGATPQVISSKTMYGAPAARTYTTSTTALRLALASGTLAIRTAAISTLGV